MRRRLQAALPPAHVVPLALLEANLAVRAQGLESNRFVQRHAGHVGQGNAGECLAVAESDQDVIELSIQPFSDALTARVLADVGRGVYRPLVGSPLAVLAGVYVSVDPALRVFRSCTPSEPAPLAAIAA